MRAHGRWRAAFPSVTGHRCAPLINALQIIDHRETRCVRNFFLQREREIGADGGHSTSDEQIWRRITRLHKKGLLRD